MPQTESLVDQGVDRVQDALKSADKEFQRIQRRVKTQRRTIERQIGRQRKTIEKQAKSFEKQAQKRVSEIRKTDLVKRVESLRKDVQEQLETGFESVLAMFQIASKADIQRVDRKLNRINRKLKELEAAPSSSTQA